LGRGQPAEKRAEQPRRWDVMVWIQRGILLVLSVWAANWVGYLLGWLTGASQSPVAPAIAPLVFGLLAALGIGISLKELHDRGSIWHACLVAIMVCAFVYGCQMGVTEGAWIRSEPYSSFDALLSENWRKLDDETIASLHHFRLVARMQKMPAVDFD